MTEFIVEVENKEYIKKKDWTTDKMSVFAIAYQTEYGCYKLFRIVDDLTGDIKDINARELFHKIAKPNSTVKIQNLRIDKDGDSFEFINCDTHLVPILDKDKQPKINANALFVFNINGDTVKVANYKGQILIVPMTQVVGNVRQAKYRLANADILPNNRIVFLTNK